MSLLRRFIAIALTISMILTMGMCAFAEEPEQETAPAAQSAPAAESAPAAAPAPAAEEPPAVNETPVVSETPVANETVVVENTSEEPPMPADTVAAQEEQIEKVPDNTAAEETDEEAEKLLPIFFWVDPLTGELHAELTYFNCMGLILKWIEDHPEFVLLNNLPTKSGDPAPVPGYLPAEEANKTDKPADTSDAPAESKPAQPASYHVEFTVGETAAKFDGGKDVSLAQLLKALGIDFPEDATLAVDPASVDSNVMTVGMAGEETVLNTKGAFTAASKPLVVLINGVPTEILVTDGMSAEDAQKEIKDAIKSKTPTDTVRIESSGGKKAVIDLGGGTLKGADDADYVITVEGTDPEITEVTIQNGVIDAAKNGIHVIGNAVVKLINVTIKAVKEALHIGDGNDTLVSVSVDSDSKLVTKGESESDTTNTVVIQSPSTADKSKVNIDGTIVNKASGYAVGMDGAADIPVNIGWDAKLTTNKAKTDIDTSIPEINITGGSFSKKATAKELGCLKLDANYDCTNRYRLVTEAKDLGVPSRPGFRFIGWNTESDGTGTYYSVKNALKKDVSTLYAIWENLDYHWLISAIVKVNGYQTYVATRMNIRNKTAYITFENAQAELLEPCSVAYRDLKNIRSRGAATANMQLAEHLFFDMDLEDIALAGGSKVNTLQFYHEDDILTVISGEKVLFSVETYQLLKATKNDITLHYDRDGLKVLYGKDKTFDVPAADLDESPLLVLRDGKLVAIAVQGLDAEEFEETKAVLTEALAKGAIIKEYSK